MSQSHRESLTKPDGLFPVGIATAHAIVLPIGREFFNIRRSMRILLTGIAGFIGARTASLLLSRGHEVVGVDNMNDYYDVRLKQHRLQDLARESGMDNPVDGFSAFNSGRLSYHPIDVESYAALEPLFADGFDAIINLAARAGVRYSMENPFVYLNTNTKGVLNLVELARKNGVGKLVQASTSSLYAGQQMPFHEDLPVNTPISPYAASKKAAEAIAYTYHHLYGLDVSILRYFTVFGPAGRPDMSPIRFIRWVDEGTPITLYGDGTQSRDFTYIDDIAEGTILALKPLGYEVINLGGGNEPVTINAFIQRIEGHLGKKARIDHKPFHKADMMDTSAAIDKARRLLDWSPKVDVWDGLKRTIDWYLAQPWMRDITL